MSDFNPDPDFDREAERLAADAAIRDAEYADMIADALDLGRYDDDPNPYHGDDSTDPDWWRDEPETEW